MDDVWWASISTWKGIVGGASHYLVTLHGPGREVDAAAAARWTAHDPSYVWEAGDGAARFESKRDAHRAAIVVFERVADPARDLLVTGHRAAVVPRGVLAGNPDHVARLTETINKAEAIDWWDGGQQRNMDRIADAWQAYQDEHFRPHPYQSVYGRGAAKVIVESVEIAWGTPKPEPEIDYSVPPVVPPGWD